MKNIDTSESINLLIAKYKYTNFKLSTIRMRKGGIYAANIVNNETYFILC